jgi:hypothetical protein
MFDLLASLLSLPATPPPPDTTMTPEMIERFEATTGANWADLVAMGGIGATLTSVIDGDTTWTAAPNPWSGYWDSEGRWVD